MFQYAVIWRSVGQPDRIESRHHTLEAAADQAERDNKRLHEQNPGGNLLCGFEVVGLTPDGETRPLEDWESFVVRDE